MKTFFKTIYQGYLWIIDIVLWGQWVKFWDFIKLAHSSSDEASSKRLWGGVMITCCMIMLYLFAASVFSTTVWTYIAPYWTFVLVLGAGMISLGVVEKISALISNFKIAKIEGLPKTIEEPTLGKPKIEEPIVESKPEVL